MNYLSALAKGICPYVPGEQPQDKQYIKINTNENPYPPSEKVMQAMQQAVNDDLRRYPDPEATLLRNTIADSEGLSADNVFCGNGSDEVLAMCFLAFFNKDKQILFPDISYTFYPVYAQLFQIDYKMVEVDERFNIVNSHYMVDNGGIIFPNPNAPTGIFKTLDEIEQLCQYNLSKGVVIVDEAYIGFGGESAVSLINKYDNLLVVRTLSKSHSLAGLRLGYALGNKQLIDGLNRIKNSFNSYVCDRVAQAGAIAAILDKEYYESTGRKIILTREEVTMNLASLGFNVLPSKANFVFIHHDKINAKELYLYLKDNGVLVRYFDKPRIDSFLRVTIGTLDEMKIFIKYIKNILEA